MHCGVLFEEFDPYRALLMMATKRNDYRKLKKYSPEPQGLELRCFYNKFKFVPVKSMLTALSQSSVIKHFIEIKCSCEFLDCPMSVNMRKTKTIV
jgi:hypothetical protein